MSQNKLDKLAAAARPGGTFTSAETRCADISARTLARLCRAGKVTRISRGVYQITDAKDVASPDYAAIAKRVPLGVVCLLSALYHHDLTTEIPREICLAVNRNAAIPRIAYPRVRVFRMSAASFSAGIERKIVDGVKLQIYSAEKTIADCFKYRNRIGTEVAVEALKAYMGRRGRNLERVRKMAGVCRVEKIMRPYLESLV